MRPNLQFPADLVTFIEEILNGKLHFLCSATTIQNAQSSNAIGECICVCTCVYFLSPSRLLLTKQNNKCNTRVQVSSGMVLKYFCIKDLCHRIKDVRRKNFKAGCKRLSIKPGKATRSKR